MRPLASASPRAVRCDSSGGVCRFHERPSGGLSRDRSELGAHDGDCARCRAPRRGKERHRSRLDPRRGAVVRKYRNPLGRSKNSKRAGKKTPKRIDDLDLKVLSHRRRSPRIVGRRVFKAAESWQPVKSEDATRSHNRFASPLRSASWPRGCLQAFAHKPTSSHVEKSKAERTCKRDALGRIRGRMEADHCLIVAKSKARV